MISPREAAYFYTSWSISTLLFMIPKQIAQSLFAESSNFKDALDKFIIRSIRVISLILIPSVFIILIFGDKLLLVYGSEYSQNGSDLLRIFALSSVPLAICSIYTTIKNVESRVRIVFLVNAIIAIITLIGSYFLVGKIGLIGVGYAWFLGNMIVAIGTGFSIINRFTGDH
jgi:O-antigen/teichoic acid export membrane protein